MNDRQNKYSIMIVDDHPIIREGISKIINQQPDLDVRSEASSAREAMTKLREAIPDLAIIDVSLKNTTGIELIEEIKSTFSDFPILVLSMHSESLYAERALRAGARGYIMKHEPAEEVIKAIRQVLGGKIYLSQEMSEKILDRLSGVKHSGVDSLINSLSNRELEVFKLVGSGLKPHEIAEKLFLSVKTIETYYSRLKLKLNLKDASELRQAAIHWLHQGNLP